MRKITNFFRGNEGVTTTEYAVLLALITITLIVGALALGNAQKEVYEDTATSLSDVLDP